MLLDDDLLDDIVVDEAIGENASIIIGRHIDTDIISERSLILYYSCVDCQATRGTILDMQSNDVFKDVICKDDILNQLTSISSLASINHEHFNTSWGIAKMSDDLKLLANTSLWVSDICVRTHDVYHYRNHIN